MRHPLDDLISAKIKEAEANGDFQNLSGAGKPLPNIDDPANAYFARVMQESGAAPEFVVLAKEMQQKREALKTCTNPEQRHSLQRDIAALEPRIALAKAAWGK